MGFMDKAKKMAEQAQAKLDEAQQQFNAGQQRGGAGPGPAVEYDEHGRPIPQEPPAPVTPPHGDPLGDAGADAPVAPPAAEADAPVAPPPAPEPGAGAPPPTPGMPQTTEPPPAGDRNHPSYAPPKLSQGDPLAG